MRRMLALNKNKAAQQIKKLDGEWKLEKQILEKKQQIKKEKAQLLREEKKVTTTKKLVTYLFVCATAIQLFTGYLMIVQIQLLKQGIIITLDTSPLISLIGAVVGEVMVFAVYAIKSFKENKSMADLDFEKMKVFGSKDTIGEPSSTESNDAAG